MNSKKLYIKLISNQYNDVDTFMKDIQNREHYLWGVCRDCAQEILIHDNSWKWLAHRVDDFSPNATQYLLSKLPEWHWKAGFGSNALSLRLHSVKETIQWVIDRWIAMLKNLFNPRYKFHLKPSYIVPYEEEYISE